MIVLRRERGREMGTGCGCLVIVESIVWIGGEDAMSDRKTLARNK